MADMKMVQFHEGDIILREDETYNEMYKIIKGHAEIYIGYGTKQESLIKIIGEQTCFGELGVLLNKTSIYTVVAYSDILALKISKELLGEFIIKNHQTVIDLMKNMADTMMTMRMQLENLLKEIESGVSPDEKTLLNTKKLMRSYGMYKSIEEAVHSMKS